jgi:deazaflavin-dependent oxidoreductase (nitroreductase family)
MTTNQDPGSAIVANPPAAFPFQRPGQLMLSFFKAGACAYRGPLARLMGAYALLLLTTTGRRTGLLRRTALTFQKLDGRYLVLAGMGTRSDWYQNLLAQPRVEVQIGARRFAATAEPVLDPERRRMLAPGIAAQWDRFGPPRSLRWMLRRWLRFDYDAELAYALAHAEDLPMVELVPSSSPVRATPSW